jgi:hypothetical protein
MGGASGSRPIGGGWPCRRADRQHLRAEAVDPGVARVHRESIQNELRCLEILSDAFCAESARLRSLDSYCQATRDAREAHPRVHRAPLGGKEARPEIEELLAIVGKRV